MPTTSVPAVVMTNAALIGGGVTIGVTSPSGGSFIHISRITRR